MEQINNEKDLTLDRRAKLLELLGSNGQVKVHELSAKFNVSEVTIRNDLDHLESKNLLIRTRGGALKTQRVGIDYHLNVKRKKNYKEKQAIGSKTAELIKEGDTIILDSGTTTMEVAKNISNIKNLTVITNALNIASQLVDYPDIKVIIPGGSLRRTSLSLIGAPAEQSLKNYFCDKLIMGVDGISFEYGITTPNIEEAHINRVMIDIAKEVIVVADSSKFLRRSFALISGINKIHTVVTDKNIPEEEYQKFINAGKKVVIV
ncbi:MAG: DeoR/GlpR transcriptional regulator [Chlorobi bacterium]|nr:DeoR/GlpR transcriptional regulator [Chlorobiota bacterium]